jgi:hypothetical protein
MKLTTVLIDPATHASYFNTRELETSSFIEGPGAPPLTKSELLAVSTLSFIQVPAGWRWDWHPSPTHDFLFLIKGRFEVCVGRPGRIDERRVFEDDDLFAFGDPGMPGHQAEALTDCRMILVAGQGREV